MNLIQQLMDEAICCPGFPQIIVTRGWLYQAMRRSGWDVSERGYGSLDYIVFSAPRVNYALTDSVTRDKYLKQVGLYQAI